MTPVLTKVPSGLKHSNTMMNTVPKEPSSPMKTKKTSPRISQGNIVTPRNVKKLKVGTDMTSSLKLGDDISSLSSPVMPQLKFGASLDKKITNDSTKPLKGALLSNNSNLTDLTMQKMKSDRGEKLHYDYM